MNRDNDQPSQPELTGREPALSSAHRRIDPALCVVGLLDAAGNEERRRIIGVAAAAGQTAALTAALVQVVAAFIERAQGAVTAMQCCRAIDALQQIGSYDALPVLARASHDTHREVQYAAALALRRLCDVLPGPAEPLRLDGIFLECVLTDMCTPLTYISGYCQLIIHTLEQLSQDDLVSAVNHIERACFRLQEIWRALCTATHATRAEVQGGEQLRPELLVEIVSGALEGVRQPGARFVIDIPATLRVNCGSLLRDAILYFADRVARDVPQEQTTPVSARAWGREAVLTIGSDRPREPAQFQPLSDGLWSAFYSAQGDIKIGAACMVVQAYGGMVLVEAEQSVVRTISICLPLGSAAQPQEETRVA